VYEFETVVVVVVVAVVVALVLLLISSGAFVRTIRLFFAGSDGRLIGVGEIVVVAVVVCIEARVAAGFGVVVALVVGEEAVVVVGVGEIIVAIFISASFDGAIGEISAIDCLTGCTVFSSMLLISLEVVVVVVVFGVVELEDFSIRLIIV
jgi:hypothetical protein